MADTPKSPGRRLLRKSALQASPFGAPVRSFHSNSSNNNSNSSNNTNNNTARVSPSTTSSTTIASEAPDFNPFEIKEPATLASPPTDSPTRRSARLDTMQRSNIANINNNINNSSNYHNNAGTTSSLMTTPKKKMAKLHPPTTPQSKTIVPSFVWGEVLGLSRQDGSVYYRYPINKSYCSFGRNNLNDIRIQIDGVSETHCKLIRRDDGEVWLKDTSTNGTLLNNVLVHDTARPIQHHDIVTIGGRRFRFDTSEPIPRIPLQSTANSNTPGRQVRDIQATIDKDIQTLAEAPSPTPGRLLSTPKRSLARSTAALESSLELFTPNRAAKLSSLLVSPKPVPLPAFLSKSPRRPTTPKPVIAMIDEPSLFNTTSTATPPSSFTERQFSNSSGMHTPTKEKRKAPADFDGASRTPKKVSFGPALSPEIFDKSNPPSTPIKRGQQQDPETPRRQGLSTPSLLSKLSAAGSASKPILTPSRLSRTFLLANLERPAPPNLFAPENQQDTEEAPKKDEQDCITQAETRESMHGNDSRSLDDNSAIDVRSEGDSDMNLWKQRMVSTNYDADETALNSLAGIMDMSSEDGEQSPRPLGSLVDEDDDDDNSPPTTPTRAPLGATSARGRSEYGSLVDAFGDDDDDDDESPPATPTRGPSGRVSNPMALAPTRAKPLSPFMFQQEHNRPLKKEAASPLKSDDEELLMTAQERDRSTPSPTMVRSNPAYSEVNPFDSDSIGAGTIRLELCSPARSTLAADTTPVHTPVRRQTSRDNHDQDNPTTTPGSASRIALLQLSASKVRYLPDLLQSPSVSNSSSESAGSAPGTPSVVKLTLPIMDFSDDDDDVDYTNQPTEDTSATRDDEKAAAAEAEAEAEDEDKSQAQVHDVPVLEEEEPNDENCQTSPAATTNLSGTENWAPSSTDTNHGRRSSAPAAAMRDSSDNPFFTGLRGVFRTPQKVVESCFSGFVGFRNYVMSPSKPPGLPLLLGADDSTIEDLDDSAVEILEVQENIDGAISAAADIDTHSTSGANNTALLAPAQTLEKTRVRSRRSETLPRKRRVASPYRDQERTAKEETRRRTFSLFEYHKEDLKVSAPGLTAETAETAKTESAFTSAEGENHEQPTESQVEQDMDLTEDAEQEELLRILGEGFSPIDENEDDSQQHDSVACEDEVGNQLGFEASEEAVVQEEEHDFPAVSSRRASSRRSSYGSRASTPIKRRYSFKQRLGSSSPAFRLYEQDQDEDEEEEDVVSMISPKRVRAHLG